MCMLFKVMRLQKQLKAQKSLTREIISSLDDNTLNKIKRKCDAYITYTVDNKQLNSKQDVKTKQKEFLEMLELINTQLALNQFELCTKAQTPISENIQSTFNEAESTPVKESKKKEK